MLSAREKERERDRERERERERQRINNQADTVYSMPQ